MNTKKSNEDAMDALSFFHLLGLFCSFKGKNLHTFFVVQKEASKFPTLLHH